MNKAQFLPLKGFRDFLPEQAKKKEFVLNTLKEVFSSYGFEPLETPALEYTKTLLKKYGKEAEKLIYRFKDRGGRDIGLRYDLTVPLARVIASNPNLPMPFKRYQIAPVWRADKPQAGRFREFWQADIDIVGSTSFLSETEIISCLMECVKKLGFNDYRLFINDRKIFKQWGLVELKIMKSLDQLPTPYNPNESLGDEIATIFRPKGNLSVDESKKQALKFMKIKETEAIKKIKEQVDKLGGSSDKIKFLPFLARGLDYYTSIIFELQIGGYKNLSVGAGGRYDNLIGQFAGKDIPAVGFSFGIDRLIEAMEQQNLFKDIPPASQVLVTVFSPEYLEKSIEMSNLLRQKKIKTEVYFNEDKLDKQIKYADKRGIKYVIILGPDEVKNKTVTIKDLSTGRQSTVVLDKINEFFSL